MREHSCSCPLVKESRESSFAATRMVPDRTHASMNPSAGQHEEIVSGAVMYLQLSAPALYCYVIAECLKRYLLAQVGCS